jgi:hypothetical protein
MVRHENRQSAGAREVAVDATLEADLRAVEDAIEAYLEDPSVTRRAALSAVLQRLDQQIDLADEYESRIADSAAFGYASKGSVIGETSSASAAEEIPGQSSSLRRSCPKRPNEKQRRRLPRPWPTCVRPVRHWPPCGATNRLRTR